MYSPYSRHFHLHETRLAMQRENANVQSMLSAEERVVLRKVMSKKLSMEPEAKCSSTQERTLFFSLLFIHSTLILFAQVRVYYSLICFLCGDSSDRKDRRKRVMEQESGDPIRLMEGKDIGAQPRMESSRSFLLMHTDLDEDTTLPDVHAYRSLHYADEADKVNEFRTLCKRAKVFVTDLYSHRSLSRATPLVRSEMVEEEKKRLHRTIYEVYQPEVKKLFDVRAFSNESVELFCSTVKELISVRAVPSVQIVHAMCELVDQFAVIDTIMDTKACFTNDFSYFKRSLPTVRGMPDLAREVPEENDCQQVEDLLKGRQFILASLRNDLEKSAG
jgi:hypothetical protein